MAARHVNPAPAPIGLILFLGVWLIGWTWAGILLLLPEVVDLVGRVVRNGTPSATELFPPGRHLSDHVGLTVVAILWLVGEVVVACHLWRTLKSRVTGST
jgi:hypothetical protein